MLRLLALLIVVASLASSPLAAQTISSLAGTGQKGYSGDSGPAAKAQLSDPFDVALDRAGNVFFSDTTNHAVRRIDAKTGIITTVVGCGRKGYSGDGGPATEATLFEPYGVELDDQGNLYIVDRLNYCIRRVDTAGKISTLAGTGKSGYSGDGGPAAQAQLKEPNGIALDRRGKLYIADVQGQRIRVVDLAAGTIATFCGNGEKKHTGDDGPYGEACLQGSRAVAVGPDGSVYICEREGNSIRKVDFKTGKITRYAGAGGKGYSGDGASALAATFNGPKEIDVDAQGNVFVVDTENHAIRRIDGATGVITTVAGSGKAGGAGDGGPATEAQLNRPHGVVAMPNGTLLVGDTLNHRVRSVSAK